MRRSSLALLAAATSISSRAAPELDCGNSDLQGICRESVHGRHYSMLQKTTTRSSASMVRLPSWTYPLHTSIGFGRRQGKPKELSAEWGDELEEEKDILLGAHGDKSQVDKKKKVGKTKHESKPSKVSKPSKGSDRKRKDLLFMADRSSVQNTSQPDETMSWNCNPPEGKSIPAWSLPGPVAIISGGCAGSTSVVRLSRNILCAHGFGIMPAGSELLKEFKNPVFEKARRRLQAHGNDPEYHEIIAEAISLLNREAHANGQVLVFKADEKHFDSTVRTALEELGTVFMHSYRRNVLDKHVCLVRDCFLGGKSLIQAEDGYPVFADNGTRTELCFQRRSRPEVKVKAMINASSLVEVLNLLESRIQTHKDEFRLLVHPAEVQAEEDLHDFEYTSDEESFQRSVHAWCSFLRSVAELDPEIVAKTLRPYQNSRPPRGPHADTIYNIDEVAAALKETPKLYSFLRTT